MPELQSELFGGDIVEHAEEAAHRRALAQELGARLGIDDALIVLDVAADHQPAQLGAIHGGVLAETFQEAGVSPTQGRLDFLGDDGIAGVRLEGAEHLDLGHQAGVQADQLEFVQPGLGADLLERLVQLHQVELVAQAGGERDGRVAGRLRVGVGPAAGPAHAVVREDQDVAIGGVGLRWPR